METRFQTSFIPKKTLPTTGASGAAGLTGVGTNFRSTPPHRIGSLFFDLAVLLFIVSLAAAVGMYGWKSLSLSQQDALKQQLAERQQQFNPDLIAELKRINVKIDAAKQLLASHLALSNVFGVISRMTAENIRFTSMDLTAPTQQSGDIKVALDGYGKDLSAVAFQSDVLSRLNQYGLDKIVKNPILSNPSLDPAGAVSFKLAVSLDPSALSYADSVSGSAANASSAPAGNSGQ
ncbi:hypothetical protein KGQ27_03865 [Patescibacteria group bacterium]|nr:hypothetical protein [Patescibacteria group bacterium]MDE2011221.1 hypothetical protein [Patescibacteria group bacterium]MDE2233637.1 hypothetical protein [Patescibacteria group bacterium]